MKTEQHQHRTENTRPQQIRKNNPETAPPPAPDRKTPHPQPETGKVLSLKVEQLLENNRAVVLNNANGTRLQVQLTAPLQIGTNFHARVETLKPEITLKILPRLNLPEKLLKEIKSLLPQHRNISETIKSLAELSQKLKGENTEPPKTNLKKETETPAPQQQKIQNLSLKQEKQTTTPLIQIQKNGKEKAVQTPPLPAEKASSSSPVNTLRANHAQNVYRQAPPPSEGTQTKPINLQELLSHKQAASLLQRSSAVLEGVLSDITLQENRKQSSETARMLQQSLQNGGLQLEKKIAELIREEKQHNLKQVINKDLKGVLAQLKGELKQLLKHPPSTLSPQQKEEVANLHKEVSQRLNSIELNQMLHLLNRDSNTPYIFQIPFMMQDTIKDATLRYKKENKDETEKKPEQLTINFFLELSNLGKLRIDGLLKKNSFHGVIGVEKPEEVQRIQSGLPLLTQSLDARGITSRFSVRALRKEQLIPPETTSAIQQEMLQDASSLLDLRA